MSDQEISNHQDQITQLLSTAIAYHNREEYSQAASLYQQVLAIDPGNSNALRFLGLIYYAQQNFPEAEKLLIRAFELMPNSVDIAIDLGSCNQKQLEFDKAIFHYKAVIQLAPDNMALLQNYAMALYKTGRYEEALICLNKFLLLDPANSSIHYLAGNICKNINQIDLAIEHYLLAIKHNPRHASAHINLGVILGNHGQIDTAISHYQAALVVNPDSCEALNNWGLALKDKASFLEAIDVIKKAIALYPEHIESYINLGVVHKIAGDLTAAVLCFNNAITLNPAYPLIPHAHYHLANIYTNLGVHDLAQQHYQRALPQDSNNHSAYSEYLLSLHYEPGNKAADIFAAHKKWGQKFISTEASSGERSRQDRSDRPLRIGYVSADFYNHAVSYFIRPILESHDRNFFFIACYSNSKLADITSDSIRNSCDVWRNIAGRSDEEVSRIIRVDGIDILVDLGGHTRENRLPVFARKPAPVQISYLGYPDTTGLPAMDYRITDSITDPRDRIDEFYTEKLLRIDPCFLCYQPYINAPAIDITGRRDRTKIVFGSFNHIAKISAEVIEVWSAILNAVPGSEMVIKSSYIHYPEAKDRLLHEFSKHGIAENQLHFYSYVESTKAHLALYNTMDIALDTFPYNGTTTTCEALWMGVPVISMQGDTHVSRVGSSILSTVGVPELIVNTKDEYIDKAIELAISKDTIKDYKIKLRTMMTNSRLTDGVAFTGVLERIYNSVWGSYKNS